MYDNKEIVYYRKKCDACHTAIRSTPKWKSAGYKKTKSCEKCGFVPSISQQLVVFYIDGIMNNIGHNNLKTLCLNCNVDAIVTGWKSGDLLID